MGNIEAKRVQPEKYTKGWNKDPKLPKVPRADRIYRRDGRRGGQIGTLQQAEDGTLTAHVLVDFPGGKQDQTRRRLVQLTAASDTDRGTLIAMMREVSEPIPSKGPNSREVKIPRRGLPGKRTVGTISESQRFALGGEEGDILMRVATLHGELRDKSLVRRPTDRQVVVAAYDGYTRPPGDVIGEAADLEHLMQAIAKEEYRITPTRTATVREGNQVRGRVRFGRATSRRTDGEKVQEGVIVASIVDDEGQVVPLVRTTIMTNVRGGTGRPSGRIGRDVKAALRELGSYYPQREASVRQVEAVEIERLVPEVVGAIDQGLRPNQEDSFGINGRIQLSDIGGKGKTEEERIVALAEILAGKDASTAVKEAEFAKIRSLQQEVTDLISEGKIRGIAAVADGMGGGENGEAASVIAVYAFQRALVDRIKNSRVVDIEFFAREAAEVANKAVFDYSSTISNDPKTKPQTAFAAYVIGPDDKVTFLKDGDCHIYLEENGTIERVLPDNSLAQIRLQFDYVQAPRLTFSEIYTPADPKDKVMGRIRTEVAHMFGGYSRLGEYLHSASRDLPNGARIFVTTDGVTESYKRDAPENREIVQEIDRLVTEKVAQATTREEEETLRAEAINLGFGQIFQRILLRGAPQESEALARHLVEKRPLNSDNAAVVIAEIPPNKVIRRQFALAA